MKMTPYYRLLLLLAFSFNIMLLNFIRGVVCEAYSFTLPNNYILSDSITSLNLKINSK